MQPCKTNGWYLLSNYEYTVQEKINYWRTKKKKKKKEKSLNTQGKKDD